MIQVKKPANDAVVGPMSNPPNQTGTRSRPPRLTQVKPSR